MFKVQVFPPEPPADSKDNKKENLSARTAYSTPVQAATATAVAVIEVTAATATPEMAVTATGIDVKHSVEQTTTLYLSRHPEFLEHHLRFKIRATHFEELCYFDSIYSPSEETFKIRSALKEIHIIELEIAHYENVLTFSIIHLDKAEYIKPYLQYRRKMADLLQLQKKINKVNQSPDTDQQILPTFEEAIGLSRHACLSKVEKESVIATLYNAIQEIEGLIQLNAKIKVCSQNISRLQDEVSMIANNMRLNILKQDKLQNDYLLKLMQSANTIMSIQAQEKQATEAQLKAYLEILESPKSNLNKFDKVLREIIDRHKRSSKNACVIS